MENGFFSLQDAAGAFVALLLVCGIVYGTFYGLAFLILIATKVFDQTLLPIRIILQSLILRRQRSVPFLANISLAAQGIVGIAFFLIFVYQVENSNYFSNGAPACPLIEESTGHCTARGSSHNAAFSPNPLLAPRQAAEGPRDSQTRVWPHQPILHFLLYLLAVMALFSGVIALWSTYYKQHFSRILFYHRFVKPVWDWVTSQSYALLSLQRVPLIRPLVGALDEVADRVNHRNWQTFLRSLFFLSLFTLPVRLLPPQFHALLNKGAHAAFLFFWPNVSASALESPWLQEPIHVLGSIYHLLLDWVGTVILLYVVITVLAPLEPRNLFPSIAAALQYFVKLRRFFSFAGYYWRSSFDGYSPTLQAAGSDRTVDWDKFAMSLHSVTGDLDRVLPLTWQGRNSRVTLVLEEIDPNSHIAQPYRFHYRRFGESAFIVAVDKQTRRVRGHVTTSHALFSQFSESIGALINVRQSLKFSGSRSNGGMFR